MGASAKQREKFSSDDEICQLYRKFLAIAEKLYDDKAEGSVKERLIKFIKRYYNSDPRWERFYYLLFGFPLSEASDDSM